MGNAAKVGAIFVVFLGLLVATYAALGQRLLGPKRVEYRISFDDAGGIVPGTKVLMAGVQVGLVREIKLLSPNLAEVTFAVEATTHIPEGTKGILPSSLVGLGETQISLVAPPGPTSVKKPDLPPGSLIQGGKAGPLDALLPNADKQIGAMLTEVTATLHATRQLLADKQLIARTKHLMNSVDLATQNAAKIAGRVDSLLARNDARINNTFAVLSQTVRNVEKTTDVLAKYAESGKLQGNVDGIFKELRTTLAQSRGLLVEFQGLVSDPNLKATIANTRDASGSAATIAKTSEATAQSAANIAKTAEGIATDGKEISARLITLTDKANAIAERATKLEDQVSNILGKFGGNRPAGASAGKGLALPPVEVHADLLQEADPEHTRVDLYADVPLGQNSIRFGFYDAFESNRLIAQYGVPLGAGQLRYGVFAGKPGVGVEYPFGSRLSIRGDVWGLNDPRLDLRFRVRIADGFYGWAGADRVFRDNAPTVGIGISF